MLDSTYVVTHADEIENAALQKGVSLDIAAGVAKMSKAKPLASEVQKLREERNAFAKKVSQAKPEERAQLITEGKEKKTLLDQKEKALAVLEAEIQTFLLAIPNPPKSDVKVGKNDTENEVIRTYKTPTQFPFTPKDHLALGEALGLIDMERASKVSGARFTYIKGDGVLLELALARYAFDFLVKEGFIPVLPPVLIKRGTMAALGYMENGGEEDMFAVEKDNLVLVGTAEQSLVPMHMDETLQKSQLPLRYVGYSPSFRREAGSYGKDTKGILRMHQFNKVEMVSFVEQGKDDAEHEYMLAIEEKFFQALDIPYQVVKMCTGDLGFPAARKYDIEAWMPGQQKYREVTSTSTCTDFQARRLQTKYQDGTERKYVNILNGTGFAMSRTPIAILENYQQEDGSVVIPEVLRPYMGKEKIGPQEAGK